MSLPPIPDEAYEEHADAHDEDDLSASLETAYPIIAEAIRRHDADQLDAAISQFPRGGASTRARWAINRLRMWADEIKEPRQ